jgi:hypothetical protein
MCPDLHTHLLCATLQTPLYASIHFERRLHNPKSFVFTQNITLLPHLFVHAIPIAQPPRSGLLQIAVSTMLRTRLDAPRYSLLPEHCRYSPMDLSTAVRSSHCGSSDSVPAGGGVESFCGHPLHPRIESPLRNFNQARVSMCSVPEIHKPILNQPLSESKNHRGRNTEHEHSICCLERSQQSPRRRHNQIAITQGRVVDR